MHNVGTAKGQISLKFEGDGIYMWEKRNVDEEVAWRR